ncbi:(Fe-S)-binding protein [Paraconexibacter antarcticus]|uniref:(Fe-S)-binding protein n=1 Tax=Paraconexibacter antarcticus TaxID=2949664 RepID=A0ABY5E149_9ACTN|nr:(Fe-S)-binding protein [Paraconexibacter antarcticus]UTI66887.1 (Fe-S)-binding protein [Paraconexibacter antarcticus]
MSPIAFSIALVLALGSFSSILGRRALKLFSAAPAARFDHLGERLKITAIYAFGQKKFLRGEQPAGLMHAFIFWGFMTLGLTVVTLFGRAFDADFYIPLLHPGQPLGDAYTLLRDVIQVTVVIAVTYALYRRLIQHTPRLFGFQPAEKRLHDEPHWEGILILFLILGIMGGSLIHEGARLVLFAGEHRTETERGWEPVSNLVSHLIPGSAAHTMTYVGFWMHNLIVLTFLNLLPLSKHFHIITAIPNVFFGSLRPRGQLSKPDPGKPDDFTWKQVLDMYSCTECGRCSAVCPATASGSPLAPRQLILDLRDDFLGRTERTDDKIVSDEVLWSCTTCMACVEACPVGIEHVPTIIQGRRKLVDQGAMEPMLQDTLQNFAQQGNSYGKSSRMRARWAKGLDFKIPDARKEHVKYLWFVGDFASFDERSQEASRRIAKILHHAGVSFGMLYEAERNAGNDVRRIGEEGLFELLVEQNMEAFAGAEFDAIFTTDPHSLNTLKNEYSEFGEMKPVYHYTELLVELIESGEIALSEPVGSKVTYHDPCYLARYNRITDAPRRLLGAVGAELLEMPRNGTNTFCCGAGGGRIWMDDSKLVERPSEQRVKEAAALGDLDYFVVTCPKDLAMYSDAAATVGVDFQVLEVSALVEQAMGLRDDGAVLAGDAA